MSSTASQLSPEHHIQIVRQLYSDASLIEQAIQQHVEANKVGYRSGGSSHPSSPTSDRRSNLSDTSSTSLHQRRQGPAPSPQNQRRSGRQQQQVPQDEQGFQVPPSSHFQSSEEELAFLRDSLKDIYETTLLEDLIAAVEKSVDERLWRHVFYTPIEELRAELRKLAKSNARREEVMDDLSKLLDKGTGFYHEMITILRCEHEIDLNTVAVDVLSGDSGSSRSKPAAVLESKPPQSRTRNGRVRLQSRSKEESSGPTYPTEALANCIQKCFVYLGDLARYRTNIRLETQTMMEAVQLSGSGQRLPQQIKPTAADWQAARRFYMRAIQIFPDSGKPYGQLAILASYANDDLDALYWYTLSLGAKCPSIIVRDNLKVFFSRYQNRYKDLLSSLSPPALDSYSTAMSTDEDDDTDTSRKVRPASAQRPALTRCDLDVLFIKIQMDLFAPHLESITFRDSEVLSALCHKVSSKLARGGFEGNLQKMIACMVFIVYDLHTRTSLSSFGSESTTKEGALGLKQAQRVGLIYLFGMSTTLLDHQLAILSQKDIPHSRVNQDLLTPLHIMIEFWMSHWDQVWGMIRLEEKWAGEYTRADLSLRNTTVAFFRSFVSLINAIRPQDLEHPSSDEISQKASCLLQQDRDQYFGLLPFRRFHTQLSICFDVIENPEETRFYRLLLFADRVIQASEGIRGTVLEMSVEPVTGDDEAGTYYRLMDADDKRLLREKGSKMLASHWLQDQVSSLQKGLESAERRSVHPNHQDNQSNKRENQRAKGLVPISTLPGTVRLPLSGQTRLTDHYQRGTPKFALQDHGHSGAESSTIPNSVQPKGRLEKHGAPFWTCVVDFSVLVWNLADVKIILNHRRCLIIVPLDVIDRLDNAKKGQEKENQKAREAIRFLDERLNIPRWGMSEPLLVAQNIKDTLSRWSEAIPFLVEESEGPSGKRDIVTVEPDGDVIMSATQSLTDPEGNLEGGGQDNGDHKRSSSGTEDAVIEAESEEEVEVRNAMNVPRVWRAILGACLFMLRKRDEAHRIPEQRFVLLTEDPDLTYFAGWFNIPASSIHEWKHNGI